ncbi:CRISPR-associated endoribonuclease Cas6 [Haloferax volcanii]|uniref:CRISPR-associated endoribonuclease Cas6 n=2 Tax=Haloferax volcanii TaxID=2246 RepID=A0A558GAW8_HALVO|nr:MULTISPECIES: CRISPR-associated endoribonuclease Cas6 [Haloferax]ELK54308.1 CRISPR-associated protein Cas6 [Haloferax sp. BAB-2207]ELZ76064.1 CRISPR-associated protein Cas6 [Haloferax lucentense DSM 14919]QIB79493.1 CRISPR-associated endoribonuclease Cas6 [Haloferax alexandrinus]TVT94907.1 CRISPR-associated endoribonuclease Cas6 [Haloferax volcanii]
MRVLIDLEAEMDAAYDTEYHSGLRRRMWDALRDTPYDEHGTETPGFSFSNPFPWGELEEGDERQLLVASSREEQLAHIVADLLENPEIHVGSMPFSVTDTRALDPDVGPPGTKGVLETATGVYAVTPPQYLDDPGADETFWRPEHGMEAFFDHVETQLQRNHDRFMPSGDPGPKEVDAPLFESYEMIKKFWLDVELSNGVEWTVLVSKWRFPYRVRDDHHRRHLNLALDVGIGRRTPLGFGFLNKRQENDE